MDGLPHHSNCFVSCNALMFPVKEFLVQIRCQIVIKKGCRKAEKEAITVVAPQYYDSQKLLNRYITSIHPPGHRAQIHLTKLLHNHPKWEGGSFSTSQFLKFQTGNHTFPRTQKFWIPTRFLVLSPKQLTTTVSDHLQISYFISDN